MNPFLAYCRGQNAHNVNDLRAIHLRQYIVETLSELAPATQRGRVAIVKAFGAWLEAEDLADADPFRKIKRPTLDRDEVPRAPNARQATDLLACFNSKDAEDFRDYVIVKLVLDTGLRRGEVTVCALEDLNFWRRDRCASWAKAANAGLCRCLMRSSRSSGST